MVYTLEEIRRRVQPVAEKYHLRAVYVFGSYARGEAREDSDIDLLIDAEGSGLRGFAYGGLYQDLEDALEKPIDLITVGSLTQPTHHKSDMRFRETLQRERRCCVTVSGWKKSWNTVRIFRPPLRGMAPLMTRSSQTVIFSTPFRSVFCKSANWSVD